MIDNSADYNISLAWTKAFCQLFPNQQPSERAHCSSNDYPLQVDAQAVCKVKTVIYINMHAKLTVPELT